MELLTQQDRENLPKLYDQENLGTDAIVHIKFFDPCGSWTWYATEASAKIETIEGEIISVPLREVDDLDCIIDVIFFGLVDGFEKELGYFSLNELQSVKGKLGIRIEKDLYFTPQPVKNFM